MTRYVTEIADAGREPEELQVMHSYPKRAPQVKTEAEPADMDVACRYRGCGEQSPQPMSTRAASEWLMGHGRQAHDDPYVGGRWTSVRKQAEAAQLGGSGPRPDQHQGEDRSMTQRIAWPPSRADLDEMTRRTEKAMADPDTSLLDRLRAAELEQLVHNQYLKQPGADAELQRDAEAEWEAGA